VIVKTGAVLFVKDLEKVASFYERVAKFRRRHTATDHVVLTSGSYELIVHALPVDVAKSIILDSPITVREDCCLKLVFAVDSISNARKVAAKLGGLVNARDREWQYQRETVCDGCDPEGNVIQFRQPRVASKPLKKRRAKKSVRASNRRSQ
jgi:predicted enzyme related to lactoylglutathione lyase